MLERKLDLKKYRSERKKYRPVVVTRADGSEVRYESQSRAAKAIGCSASFVSRMCIGREPHWKGVKVRYMDEAEEIDYSVGYSVRISDDQSTLTLVLKTSDPGGWRNGMLSDVLRNMADEAESWPIEEFEQ